jgi:Tfp pilus assembly protein PilF
MTENQVKLILAFATYVLVMWLIGRRSNRPRTSVRKSGDDLGTSTAGIREKAKPVPRTTLWVWVFLICVVATITFYIKPRHHPQPGPGQAPNSGFPAWMPLVSIVVAVAIVLCYYLYYYLRSRDPLVNRAMELSRGGDHERAIEILREAIESGRPTATRLNNLGVLYSEKGDHEAALRSYDAAENLDANLTVSRYNQASALQKLGRPAEALALLEDLPREGLLGAIRATMACTAWADLGRLDEARESLREAERLEKSPASKANRAGLEKSLAECRGRVEALESRAESVEAGEDV